MLIWISVFITCMVITAMISDVTQFIIPNLLVLIILICYPIILVLAPHSSDWKISLLIAGGAFAIGFVLFAIGIMGGGDVKLFSVLSLFVGKTAYLDFLILVAILGGVLSIVLIIARKAFASSLPHLGKSTETLPRIFKVGEPAPYGVAIGLAFIILLWEGQISNITLSN